jgi:uncharacterized protein
MGKRGWCLRLALFTALAVAPAGVSGAAPEQAVAPTWQGTLDAGAMKLRLVLHVVQGEGGGLAATLDSIDQGAKGLKVDVIRLDGDKLHLELTPLGARYDGTLDASRTEMRGTWQQGGGSLPLTFKAVTVEEKLRRPQEPQPPLPYDAKEVTFPSLAPGVTLAGTLTLPRGAAKAPAVALITGSGPEDRDETVFGHKPFLVLADHLTRRGIAVLRFDDRGVGGSSPGAPGATTRDFSADALGAAAFLKSRPEVDATRIGLLGHSEGAAIAVMAAAGSPDVAFVAMLAGAGLTGERVLELQTEAVARTSGASEAQIASVLSVNRTVYAIVREDTNDASAGAKIRKALEGQGLPEAAVEAQLKTVLSPWFRFFLTYDPATDIAKLRVPVLALTGDKDVQVVAKPNLDAIRSALERAGHKEHTVVALPGLNHLLQECKTGAIAEYSAIEQTMAPKALEMVGDWILARAKGSR